MRRVPSVIRCSDLFARKAEGVDDVITEGRASRDHDEQATVIVQPEAVGNKNASSSDVKELEMWLCCFKISYSVALGYPQSIRRRLKT